MIGAVRCSEHLGVGFLALVFTWGFAFEYLPPFKQVRLWSDLEGFHFPLLSYAFTTLKRGRIPLWDAAIYCGISFVGNVQAALLYPPSWLLFAAGWHLPRLPFKAVEAFLFCHLWLAFFLCYIWLRGRTGRMASALGSAVFAYSGFLTHEAVHLGIVATITWLPLGLWGIDEAARERRWQPLWKVATASALSFLAGFPAMFLVCCFVMLLYAIGSCAKFRTAAGVTIALAVSGLLSAAQLLPAMDARSMMVLEPKFGAGEWGWRSIVLSYFLPNWFDFNRTHATDYNPGCLYLYLGLPGLFAVLWALWQRKPRSYLQPLGVLAVTLVLANPPEHLIKIVDHFPALDHTMQQFTFYGGASAMAALITAISLDNFLNTGTMKRQMPGWLVAGFVSASIAWAIRQLWIRIHGGVFPVRSSIIVPTVAGLAVFAAGLWLFKVTAGRRRALAAAAVLFTAGVDYIVFGSARWFNAVPGDVDQRFNNRGIRGMDDVAYAELLSHRTYRIACDEQGSPYPTDFRFWGLTTPQGFDPFLPAQYHDLIDRWTKFQTNRVFYVDLRNEQMLRLLGIRYVITREGIGYEPFLSRSSSFRAVGDSRSYYRVYEYLHPLAPYHWDNDPFGTAEPEVWTPERRELRVQSERGGRFVLAEQFFPGWQAMLDGHNITVERWNGAFQAVEAPAGQHLLTFTFRPVSLRVGAVISLLTAILVIIVAVGDFRRRRLLNVRP